MPNLQITEDQTTKCSRQIEGSNVHEPNDNRNSWTQEFQLKSHEMKKYYSKYHYLKYADNEYHANTRPQPQLQMPHRKKKKFSKLKMYNNLLK